MRTSNITTLEENKNENPRCKGGRIRQKRKQQLLTYTTPKQTGKTYFGKGLHVKICCIDGDELINSISSILFLYSFVI